MIDQTLESNYVISKLRPDLPEVMADWSVRSAVYRDQIKSALDLAYGGGAREKLDIFYSDVEQAPLLIYFHGGYWQRCDKDMFSFIAAPFVSKGVDVAIVGYPLCPQVTLTALVDSIRRAMVYLYSQAEALNLNANRFNLCGSSAGGHLVTMMLATDWALQGSGMPNDFIKFSAPISGIYDLDPLRQTSLNEALNLDAQEARNNSPLLKSTKTKSPILAAVGGAETPVFFTQQESFVEQWKNTVTEIEQYIEPDTDHFDMIERLGDDSSGIFGAIFQRLA